VSYSFSFATVVTLGTCRSAVCIWIEYESNRALQIESRSFTGP